MTDSHTPKQQTPTRTPTLLPQSANQTIRPNQASSVSTQTSVNQNQVIVGQKNAKLRQKPTTVRPAVPNLKTDAGNQTKMLTGGQTIQQIPTSAGTKMVVTMSNNGTQMIQQMIPKQQQTFLQQVIFGWILISHVLTFVRLSVLIFYVIFFTAAESTNPNDSTTNTTPANSNPTKRTSSIR